MSLTKTQSRKNDHVMNKSYSRNVFENQFISQRFYVRSFWWCNRLEQSFQHRISWRVQCERSVNAIFSIDIINSNSHVFFDIHVTILCCLLSKTYDAWRAESCQKYLQKLLFDLIERWVLWWNENKKSNKFRNLMYSTRSRLIIFFSQQLIDSTYEIER